MTQTHDPVEWTGAVTSAHLFKALYTHGMDSLLLMELTNEQGLVLRDLNTIAEQRFALKRNTILGKPLDQLMQPERAVDLEDLARACLVEHKSKRYENTFHLLDGPRRIGFQLIPVTEPAGSHHIILLVRDCAEGNDRVHQLDRNKQVFRTLVENSDDTIARYDRRCIRVYANPALVRQAGVPVSALIGKTPKQFPGGPNAEKYHRQLESVMASGKGTQFELVWRNGEDKDQCSLIRLTPEYDVEGGLVSVLAVGRDITDIDQYRKKVRRLAYFDTLSSLPNRTLFYSRLRKVMEEAENSLTGLIVMDIDRFKVINDSLGHIAGDILLRKIAMRLNRLIGKRGFIARLGGDEFAVILPDLPNEAVIGRITQSVQGIFRDPFKLMNRELFVTASLGVSLSPHDSDKVDDLIMFADSAMHQAKHRKERIAYYESGMTLSVTERMTVEAELRRALQRDELRLHYQPKICLRQRMLVGCEALVRWQHPERGLLTPNHFIGIAEETHMILELGDWVLRTACRDAARWNRQSRPCRVAINLSAHQFEDPGLAHRIDDILLATGCRPDWIELEITESLLLQDRAETRMTLEKLRRRGINIAIDDFGTGYSALNYLTRFPINVLKIDRSFVSDITRDENNRKLVQAITNLAKSLNLTLIAEGIETEEEADYLTELGCQFGQGFHFSRPITDRQFGTWLNGRKALPETVQGVCQRSTCPTMRTDGCS